MTELEKYSEEINRLCVTHKVKSLYAFGSVVSGKLNEKSDIDFVVDFEPVPVNQYADNYYALKFSLQDIFLKRIDLLEERAIKNPYFRKSLNDQRILVYGH
jgi:Predicted nucleotidyltransferases